MFLFYDKPKNKAILPPLPDILDYSDSNDKDERKILAYETASEVNKSEQLPIEPGANTFDIHAEAGDSEVTETVKDMGVGAQAVVSLSKTIRNPDTSTVYFDNYFSSIRLFLYMKDGMKTHCLGTLRNNQIGKCPLIPDKDLLRCGRGIYDYKKRSDLIIVKWADTKCVLIGSTIFGTNPLTTVKRYSKTDEKNVEVQRGNIELPLQQLEVIENDHDERDDRTGQQRRNEVVQMLPY
ncbi:hypothetical protein ILUMI_02279 [Ignelater luminosus]|uniref:PiggyBac transposable element-derived protein domain-containing protein n=1 Tax=Ignelater luminosus TaxID=2038154 RepID=A0A8K0GKZ2_IGNLU|nr:hypothetical protein ILUMI_02279 [Ignelater luminosus]